MPGVEEDYGHQDVQLGFEDFHITEQVFPADASHYLES
jgi:hypothetical protein